MAEIIILELPEPLAQRVKEVAAFKQQRVEDVLIEWIKGYIIILVAIAFSKMTSAARNQTRNVQR